VFKNLSYWVGTKEKAVTPWLKHIVSVAHTLVYLVPVGFGVLSRKRRVTIGPVAKGRRLGCFAPPTVVTVGVTDDGLE